MKRSRKGAMPAIVLLTATFITYWEYMKYLALLIVFVWLVVLVIKIMKKAHFAVLNYRSTDVDAMDGISFEYFAAQLLADRGYTNIQLTEKYDYGVDIIAEKDGIRWDVQVKRYSGLVKAEAVRQVVTGLRVYGCDRAMVITNSTYSNVARQLAVSNDCVLIDRNGLHELAR